jgi:hypothetical protein
MKPVRALQKSSGNSSTTNCGSGAATSGSDRHPFTLPPLVAGTAVLAGCIDILLVSVRRTKVSRCHFFYRGRDRTSVLGRTNRRPPSDPMPPKIEQNCSYQQNLRFERRKKADAKQLRAISSLRRNVRLINKFIAGGIHQDGALPCKKCSESWHLRRSL